MKLPGNVSGAKFQPLNFRLAISLSGIAVLTTMANRLLSSKFAPERHGQARFSLGIKPKIGEEWL